MLQTKRTNVLSNNWTDASGQLIRESDEDQQHIDPVIMEGDKSEEGSSYYSEGEESEFEESEDEDVELFEKVIKPPDSPDNSRNGKAPAAGEKD